jgi:GNAT superfamily N-acetyltransferase
MKAVLREATREDIPGIWRVRYAVTENTLAPGRISDEDVRREIEDTGKGWVIEDEGKILGFAVCNVVSGNIWALFVDPEAQGQGLGSRLHDAMLQWLQQQPVPLLWLTTGADTKASALYEHKGWQRTGITESGEIRFERRQSPEEGRHGIQDRS